MKRLMLSVILLAALLVTSVVPAFAAPPVDDPDAVAGGQGGVERIDDRPDPLTTQQKEMKALALQAKLNGKAYGKTAEVARGQFVELARVGGRQIWTVMGEFKDLKHNELPEPDRSVDNTTLWVKDFSRQYFKDLLFAEGPGVNSMRQFYLEQSSGRYIIAGDVTDWIPVPGDAWTYDDDLNSPLGGNAVWYFLKDSVNGWYDSQIAAGKTPEQINEYLSQFDVWDRYDYNGNGKFNEPDGYIDTFQSVHAGEGNEAGGGILGDAAIWSHSWYAFYYLQGIDGPSFNPLGGLQIGDSDFWVGKYTIQPENGGVGVFTHEFGHDLGLPDLYDTSGGENSTGFWTLMSSGSWMGDGTEDIGSKSSHMGAWEKFQLGWLNYDVAYAGRRSAHKIGPMETNTRQAQALFVVLPKKEVVANIGAPYAGSSYYYSGMGDNLDNVMVKQFTLPAGATLTAKVKYQIELDWDYAYLMASTDGGVTWQNLETNLSTMHNPEGQNFGNGITGVSNGWVDLTAALPEGNVLLAFRYWTDVAETWTGFMVDEIAITGQDVDGAETDTGWTFTPASGFRRTTGVEKRLYNNYYVAEFRQYRGYDTTLKVGPYNFGFLDNPALQNWVEHFPYQDGLLINYWDTSQTNNQVRNHPGQGLLLPIDAHPELLKYEVTLADGTVAQRIWRNRIQTHDATFGFEATDPITLHFRSNPFSYPSLPAVTTFDDRNQYYRPENPMGGVINPNTGTQIRIVSYSAQGNFMQVEVRPAK